MGLTERETEILKALAKGMTTQAIGRELWVSVPTVKFHLRNVYRKLGVKNRTCAARWAYDHGLASPLGSPEPSGAEHSRSALTFLKVSRRSSGRSSTLGSRPGTAPRLY